MRKLRLSVLVLGAALSALIFASVAVGQSPHFVKTPTCTLSSNGATVTCSGKIAGVGTEPTQVGMDVAGGCVNNGGNQPPGHIQAVTAPIPPKGGNIVFGPLSVSATCPPGQSPVFGDTVTIFIVQNGVRTVVGTVPIT